MHVDNFHKKEGLSNIKAIISNTIHCISLLYKYIQIHSCNDENKIMMIRYMVTYIVAFCIASYSSINLECHLLFPTKTLDNGKILGYFHYKVKEYIAI